MKSTNPIYQENYFADYMRKAMATLVPATPEQLAAQKARSSLQPSPLPAGYATTPEEAADREAVCRACADFKPSPPCCRQISACQGGLPFRWARRLLDCPANKWKKLTQITP